MTDTSASNPALADADAESAPPPMESPASTGGPEGVEPPAPRRRGAKWLHAGRLLLAPVLATLAVGVHWWLNVPEHVKVSARDQGAPAAKDKKKPKKKSSAAKPRQAGEIKATWERYVETGTDFDSEPTRASWSRTAKALINKTVLVARKHAFAGAPEDPGVNVHSVECKTVSCRFILRSQFPHEIDLLDDALQKIEVEGESIWLHYAGEKIGPPKEGLPADETYLQVTAVFTVDDLSDEDMRVAEETIAGGAAEAESLE